MARRRPETRAHTVSGGATLSLLEYGRSRGAELGDELERLGLDPDALAAPEARVPVATNELLWTRLAAATRDPCFGLHFAERAGIDALHVVGHLAASSATFGHALSRIVRYSRLLHDAGRTEVEHEGDVVRIYPGCRGLPEPPPPAVADFAAAATVVVARAITGEPVKPTAVGFHHGAPPRLDEHLRLFGVCPTFDAPETVVTFDAAVLALPVRGADSRIGHYLEAYARDLLARLPPADDLHGRVLRAIVVGVPRGDLELRSVAAQLGITPRTLQRRLAGEGLTFGALVAEVQRGHAERYLLDGRLAIGEIAFLLGFRDVSNFHKAFRRWTGVTPGTYRARGRPPVTAHGQSDTDATNGTTVRAAVSSPDD